MSDVRRVTRDWRLYAEQESAWALFVAGVIRSARWTTSLSLSPVVIDLRFEATSRAIYVARPTEMVRGGGMVMFLPMEPDHQPDAWEPMLMEFKVNGDSLAYAKLDDLLAACGPSDRVADVRAFVAQVNDQVARRKGFLVR